MLRSSQRRDQRSSSPSRLGVSGILIMMTHLWVLSGHRGAGLAVGARKDTVRVGKRSQVHGYSPPRATCATQTVGSHHDDHRPSGRPRATTSGQSRLGITTELRSPSRGRSDTNICARSWVIMSSRRALSATACGVTPHGPETRYLARLDWGRLAVIGPAQIVDATGGCRSARRGIAEGGPALDNLWVMRGKPSLAPQSPTRVRSSEPPIARIP